MLTYRDLQWLDWYYKTTLLSFSLMTYKECLTFGIENKTYEDEWFYVAYREHRAIELMLDMTGCLDSDL